MSRIVLFLSLSLSLFTAACSTSGPGRDGRGLTPRACHVGGCSGQLCTSDPDAASTCEWHDSYACYAEASCEVQADGECGWTQTPELEACLAGGPVACLPVLCEIACEHGFLKDAHGCDACACAPPPLCEGGPICAIYCEHGYADDEHGCPTCACLPAPCGD